MNLRGVIILCMEEATLCWTFAHRDGMIERDTLSESRTEGCSGG